MLRKKKENQGFYKMLTPLLVMVFFLLALLTFHFIKSRQTAAESVASEMYGTADSYAEDLREQIESMSGMAIPPARYLEESQMPEETLAAETGKIGSVLEECTSAKKVLICGEDGNGFWGDGTVFAGEDKDLLGQIFEGTERHLFRYETTEDEKYIVSCVAFKAGGKEWNIAMFYDLSTFQKIVKSGTYDVSSFVALTDRKGKIILDNGSDSRFLHQEGILDFAKDSTDEDVVKFKTRMNSKSKASVALKYAGESRVLYAVPVGVDDMYVIMGSKQSYVNRRISTLNRTSTIFLQMMVVVVLIFAGNMLIQLISDKVRVSRSKQELEEKADTDLLTGLYNKLATERKIKEYMQEGEDASGMLILIDLDNFKKINDTKGHAFGDQVLRTLGTNLSPMFRATDIVGRIGGDEFMVFLKGVTDKKDVEKQCQKVVTFFRNFRAGDYVKYSVTGSIGVALCPQEGDNFETLYKAADKALYKSKRNGKNQVAFLDDSLDEMAERINCL